MNTPTILVTGATGNVGRPLVAGLLADGARVRALTRDPAAAGFPPGVAVAGGTRWSVVSTPSANAGPNPIEELTAVTAVSATDLWASGWVGNVDNENKLEPVILHSAGSSWSPVKVPNPGSEGSRLNGITSDGADDVFAVGTTQDSNGSLLTLIEQFNGSSWATVSSPDPGKSGSHTDNALDAAGSAASQIWAVGAFNKQGDCCDLPLAMDATVPGR